MAKAKTYKGSGRATLRGTSSSAFKGTRGKSSKSSFVSSDPGERRTSLKATVRDQSGAGRAKIGEILSKEGYITSLQLEEALNYQNRHQDSQGRYPKIGQILAGLGYIDENTIPNVLGRLYKYPVIRKDKLTPTAEALKLLPYEIAKVHLALPLRVDKDTFELTMTEPTDTSAVETLQTAVKMSLKVCVSAEKDIIEAYREHYKISEEEYKSFTTGVIEEEVDEALPITEVDDFGSLVSEAAGEIELQSPLDDAEDEYLASDAPIIKLVNGMIIKAINDGISDIHIEPFEKALQVRYRLDGALFKSMNLPITIKNALTSRMKILSGLNIAERRVPQDGRIKMRLGKTRAVDLRVSTLPTLFGESVVLRILDKGALNIDLTKMGFEPDTLQTLKRCIHRPYGTILVTGPTGSGKTTTLYSVLNLLNTEDTKILTAEDPVEFNFKGINQVNVKEDVGMTFAAALRSFLRQDPDVIMVGEIRDYETAEIAMKAAMTGHMVFSTVHTNDSPSTIGRLIDIGIPAYILASSVTAVLSQRLVRKLCPKCKRLRNNHDTQELTRMGFDKKELDELRIYGPVGCPRCNGSGYRGRTGLYELMEVTDEVSKAVNAQVPEDQLRKVAL